MARKPASPDPDARHARVLPVVEDAIARRMSGEDLSDEAIIGCHPDLMPELRDLLGELRGVEAARRHAAQSSEGWGDTRGDPSIAPVMSAIPGYDIREEIHRGGQGVVFRAVQKSTKRDVAIKVLREGPFTTAGERARFQREVEILATLDHPNIVTIHDSGSIEGRHYLVMDYVAGSSLDTFIDGRATRDANTDRVAPAPDIRHTLRLFLTICQAVNAAHVRGVIHRDIKPSNIRIDPAGRPHVLDFGLAKLSEVHSAAAPAADVTIAGQFIGSLPWCSPEQAEGRPDKIDMRSDVYSLGVVLFRILTGHLPHEPTGTTREILDRILREPPPSPSRHNSALDDDISTIVLKCLDKDPHRRYQTAGQLADDVERYLRGEAIEAKRDSGWYVLKKTLQRYRVRTAVAVGLVLLVTASAIALGILYRKQETQRKRAEQAEQLAEHRLAEVTTALGKANVETRKAEITSGFLRDMLAAADPNTAQGDEVTVGDILDAASDRVADELGSEPLVAAAVYGTIGRTYLSLGRAEEAERSFRAALDASAPLLPPDHGDVLTAANGLATSLEDQSRFEEAETLYRKTLDLARAGHGVESPIAIEVLHNLANLLRKRGKSVEAQVLLQEVLDRSRRILGEENPSTLTTRKTLATIWQDTGNYDAAEAEFRDILAIQRRTLGDRAPMTLGTMNHLAMLLKARGRLDDATPLYQELIRLSREVLGPDHPDTLRNMNSYGRLLHAKGQLAEAETMLREALDGLTRKLGEDHFDTIVTMNNLSLLLSDMGRLAEAEPLAQAALERGRALLGDEHPDTLVWMNNLANLFVRQANYAAAEELFHHVIDARRRVLGAEHPQTLTSMSNYALILIDDHGQRLIEGEAIMRYVLQQRQDQFGQTHPDTLLSMSNLVKALLARELFEEAEPLALQALSISRETLGPAHALTLLIANNAGATLARRGRQDEAISLLSDAVVLADKELPPGHVYQSNLRATLGRTLVEVGRYDEARPHLAHALQYFSRTLGPEHPTTRKVADQLAKIDEAPGGAPGVSAPLGEKPPIP